MIKFSDKRGLSLVEMVVVVGVFGITMTVALTILVNSLRNQRAIRAEQEVTASARDAIESLAREIRLGYIDYEAHVGQLNSEISELSIKTSGNETYTFELDDGRLIFEHGEDVSYLSSDKITINSLKFYVRPSSDPNYLLSCIDSSNCDAAVYPIKSPGTCTAGVCEIEDVQPRVTIVLHAENNGPGFSAIDLQTTVSSRTYKR